MVYNDGDHPEFHRPRQTKTSVGHALVI